MPFALQTQRINGTNSVSFDFSSLNQGNIASMVYGIQQFCLTSANQGAAIQDFGVSLTVGENTGASALMQQKLAGDMDPSQSWCDVIVLAWLGGANPQNILLRYDSIAVGTASNNPQILENPPIVSTCVLNGFQLSFAASDSNFLAMGASAGAAMTPAQEVTAVASGSLIGDSPFSGTIGTGLIALSPNSLSALNIACAHGALGAGGNCSTSIYPSLGSSLSAAAIFIQSFYAQFDIGTQPSPDFTTITAGAYDVSINGGTVDAQVAVTIQGEVVTGYGDSTPAKVTSSIMSYLVVGLTE
jgi:hypothetical protein